MTKDDRGVGLLGDANQETAGERFTAAGYQLLYDHNPSILITTNEAGVILLANRFGAEYLGFTPAELIGRSILDIVHVEDRGAFLAHVSQALEEPGTIHRIEIRKVRRDGSILWVREGTRAVLSSGEAIVVQSCEDISERIEAEAAVREREARLRQLTDNLREVFWITDPEFTSMAFISPAFEEIWGRARDRYYDHAVDILAAVDEDDRRRVAAEFERMQYEDREVEFTITRPDGSQRHVVSRGFPVRTQDGVVERVVGITEDVTERRRLDERQRLLVEAGRVLASSLDYETTLANVAKLAVSSLADWCLVDLCEKGRIRRVAVAHADPTMAEFVREYQERYPPNPDAPFGGPRAIREGTSELLPEISDEVLAQAARDPRHLEMLRILSMRSGMVAPLKIEDRVLGAITFFCTQSTYRFDEQDLETAELLASRAALAIEKARLYRDAQEATTLRDEVLSVVSHDLRNPLNTVTLSAGFLREILADDERGVTKQLEIIQRSADQMQRLIEDLLDVAQIESGKLPVELQKNEIHRLVAEACQTLKPLAEEKGIEMECVLPDDPRAVMADRNRLLQVFSNLIGNAIKFTGEGGRIMIAAEPVEGGVRFLVRDSGPGIEPEDLPHLFDRFYQSKKTKRGGAGLGLAIVKGIISAHGGEISVESTVGEGSTFIFRLPQG